MEFLQPKFNCGSDLRFACDDCKKEECGRIGFQNCDCCRATDDPDIKRCPVANGGGGCDCDCHCHPHPKILKRARVRSNMTALEALNNFDVKVVEEYLTTFSKISDYLYDLYDLFRYTKVDEEKKLYAKLCKKYIRFCIKKYKLENFPTKEYMRFLKTKSKNRQNGEKMVSIAFYPTKSSLLKFYEERK